MSNIHLCALVLVLGKMGYLLKWIHTKKVGGKAELTKTGFFITMTVFFRNFTMQMFLLIFPYLIVYSRNKVGWHSELQTRAAAPLHS